MKSVRAMMAVFGLVSFVLPATAFATPKASFPPPGAGSGPGIGDDTLHVISDAEPVMGAQRFGIKLSNVTENNIALALRRFDHDTGVARRNASDVLASIGEHFPSGSAPTTKELASMLRKNGLKIEAATFESKIAAIEARKDGALKAIRTEAVASLRSRGAGDGYVGIEAAGSLPYGSKVVIAEVAPIEPRFDLFKMSIPQKGAFSKQISQSLASKALKTGENGAMDALEESSSATKVVGGGLLIAAGTAYWVYTNYHDKQAAAEANAPVTPLPVASSDTPATGGDSPAQP